MIIDTKQVLKTILCGIHSGQVEFEAIGLRSQAVAALESAISMIPEMTAASHISAAYELMCNAKTIPFSTPGHLPLPTPTRALSLIAGSAAEMLYDLHGSEFDAALGMSITEIANHFNDIAAESDDDSFILALAKGGAPVRTRDGRPVRIICFNTQGPNGPRTNGPLLALVMNADNSETPVFYDETGKQAGAKDDDASLVML
ncbi:hypothetical protein D3C87_616440 [compost metagenome]